MYGPKRNGLVLLVLEAGRVSLRLRGSHFPGTLKGLCNGNWAGAGGVFQSSHGCPLTWHVSSLCRPTASDLL